MSRIRSSIPPERFKEFVEQTRWYHTLDLGHGLVTSGVYDLRPLVPRHGFPADLHGQSVLDVGCSDGFYSFEFERRGAASVLAVDLNRYDGTLPLSPSPAHRRSHEEKHQYPVAEYDAFGDVFKAVGLDGANKLCVAADYLDSRVQFRNGSILELDSLGRTFDFVFCGALMEHLKNPLLALEQLRNVTAGLCVVTLSSALRVPRHGAHSWRMRVARRVLSLLDVREQFLSGSEDLVLKYVGNESGGSFFQIHPFAFREMALASGFREVLIGNAFDALNRRWNLPVHNVVFHCRP